MKLEDITLEKVKKYSVEELIELSSLIREKIINTVSVNGGHLASNLGVVELTIAIHKVFNSPIDKIIFDVSHQAYTHKLLTGRANDFSSLRKYNGISGFVKTSESVHDCFEAGHSSTSISAGIGFLEAKKNNPDKIGEVISIIGDASIVNGVSFEALNYLGALKNEKMIIIINDNHMSISENVGVISQEYEDILKKGSKIDYKKATINEIDKLVKDNKATKNIFTCLGFDYIENINGHDFYELINCLEYAKQSKNSIVLHVNTIKGKGYKYSEADKVGIYHAVEPFNKDTGCSLKKYESFGNALCATLKDIAAKDSNDVLRVMSPAMFVGMGAYDFVKSYPSKTMDMGIAEENAVIAASAMAQNGLKPVMFIYSTFLQRAFDEVMHDVARSNTHVVFLVDHSGIVSGDGSTHQGVYDVGFLHSLPNCKVFQPSSKEEARMMLIHCYEKETGPVFIRYPKGEAPSRESCFDGTYNYHILREHENTFILTCGVLVNEALSIDNVGVIEAPVTSEIDDKLLRSLAERNARVIIWEDVIKNGSMGEQIMAYLFEHHINLNAQAVSLPNVYLEEGSVKEIMDQYNIGIDSIKKLLRNN